MTKLFATEAAAQAMVDAIGSGEMAKRNDFYANAHDPIIVAATVEDA